MVGKTEKTLFGEIPKQEKKVEEKKEKTKSVSYFNRYDLISFLIKTIRLGDKEKAIEILWVMLEEWVSELYIARKMANFSAEDSIWWELFIYAVSVHDWIKINGSEINALSRLILTLCDSKKFRHSAEESYWEANSFTVILFKISKFIWYNYHTISEIKFFSFFLRIFMSKYVSWE